MALPVPPFLPLRIDALRDRYVLERELGRGGMATVYLARDLRHERPVAFKLMHAEYVSGVGAIRFRQEIRLAARLSHPNILPVFDSGEIDGRLWFTMPWVDGPTLRQHLQHTGPLPLAQVSGILEPVVCALAYAHRNGVIHRDLKPENVLLDGDAVYLADFGVARPLITDSRVTTDGALIGTPAYMAPEQIGASSAVDHRADLYAFGVLAYELLAGRPPFTALSPGLLFVAHASETPEPITRHRPDVPAALAVVISKSLRKSPADRWDSAEAILAQLRAISGRASTRPTPPRPVLTETVESSPYLERARTAFDRTAWQEAYDSLIAADSDGALEADDLARLAEAAWWISNSQASLRARERAYREYLARGNTRAAASMAILLAEDQFHRRNRAVGRGWLRRAERHLEDQQNTRERGWLYRLKLVQALDAEGDPNTALEYADRALEIAQRSDDRDLAALALQDRGRVLIALGRVSEGMALMDEAMTAVIAGELTPRTTGRAYCNLIATCERLGDVARAAQWHEVAEAWSRPYLSSGFPGMCRVHRASILRRRGDLTEAEREAGRAAAELEDFLEDLAGEAFYELGEVHRDRGEFAKADAMFREAHARGRDPQPGLALVRLAQGDRDGARDMIERALFDAGRNGLARVRLLPARVQIALANADLTSAAAAVTELEGITATYGSGVFDAWANVARARLELANGNATEASLRLRIASKRWAELDLPVELARTRLLLALAYRAMGNLAEAELEHGAAVAASERLGINPSHMTLASPPG